ncbi:oxygenase MpaB family protein [Frankia sp. Cr2]|uniref:oxygenase MpaB family protein n=1 Tax=Frankia sp. Cr2 TaxID=3073932 RepID=UPI002AD1EF12|nr:oxygenase MpaB family protein [Frankia sp. Cr2]
MADQRHRVHAATAPAPGAAPGAEPTQPDGDVGLFGPSSVTWRVHDDPSMIIAGIRALLLQAVHPLAMTGVAHHSTYRTDPWGRLRRTVDYVDTITYGSTDAAHCAAARVRRVHAGIHGVDAGTGRPYRATDPELLLWVHVSEVESFLSTTRRCGLALTDRQADTYFAEQVRAAELVGIPARDVPSSRAEVEHYLTRMRPGLRVTAASREAVGIILRPPMPRWVALATPARPAWSALAAIAVGMLPGWTRRLYGLPDVAAVELIASLCGKAARAALLGLPRSLFQTPGALRRPALPAPTDEPTGACIDLTHTG